MIDCIDSGTWVIGMYTLIYYKVIRIKPKSYALANGIKTVSGRDDNW